MRCNQSDMHRLSQERSGNLSQVSGQAHHCTTKRRQDVQQPIGYAWVFFRVRRAARFLAVCRDLPEIREFGCHMDVH